MYEGVGVTPPQRWSDKNGNIELACKRCLMFQGISAGKRGSFVVTIYPVFSSLPKGIVALSSQLPKNTKKKKTTTQITDNHKNIRQCARLALLITVLCSVTINVIQFKFFSDSYLKWGNCGVSVYV